MSTNQTILETPDEPTIHPQGTVWATPSGERYHTFEDCRHLPDDPYGDVTDGELQSIIWVAPGECETCRERRANAPDTHTLKFDPSFPDLILSGYKTATIRWGFDRDAAPGDTIEMVDAETGETFATARLTTVKTMTCRKVVEKGVEGHREYDTLNEFAKSMREYYPDGAFHGFSEVTVLGWRDVEKVES